LRLHVQSRVPVTIEDDHLGGCVGERESEGGRSGAVGDVTRGKIQTETASFGAEELSVKTKRRVTHLMRKMRRLGSELNLSTRDWRDAVEVEPSNRLNAD
jgi:hypothetical protein